MESTRAISLPYPETQRLNTAARTIELQGRWWKSDHLLVPLGIFIIIRSVTLIAAFLFTQVSPVTNPFASHPIFMSSLQFTHPNSLTYHLLGPWQRWDTGWYMRIAGEGYRSDDGTTAFLPVYPVLVAAVGNLLGDMLVGSLIVSSVSCLIALIFLYQLIKTEMKSRIRAQYTLLALVSFPTGFYLLAGYTESTFLALVLGVWLAAQHRRWWLTAALMAFTVLTRMQGVVLCLPIAWMAFGQARLGLSAFRVRGQRWSEIMAKIAAVGGGPLILVSYNQTLSFSGLGSITGAYNQVLGWQFSAPWVSVNDMLGKIVTGHATVFDIGQFVALALVIALSLASLRCFAFVYQLYLWPTLIFVLTPYSPRHFLVGMMRYSLYFFPIFPVIGIVMVKYPRMRFAIICCGAALQCVMLFSFVHWIWIA